MKFKKQNINNLILIEPEPYSDEEECLEETFVKKNLKKMI